jgi:hypothetical protein
MHDAMRSILISSEPIISRAHASGNRFAAALTHLCLPFVLLCVPVLISGCARRDPQAELRAAMAAARAKQRACLPDSKPESAFKLAIASVSRQSDETSVRLVAYTTSAPADFDTPVYLMSRGRWLINEQGRAYLLDEECREYKLKGRREMAGPTPTPTGRVRLGPGQAFEITLSFPRLPDETREGALVYGQWVLPFSLLIEAR